MYFIISYKNKKNSGSDTRNTTNTISIKSYLILQGVSSSTANQASNEVLPYGMYTIARKLCQVKLQSARLRMSGAIPLLTPYALMARAEKTLVFKP
jgi:hypothetical protein